MTSGIMRYIRMVQMYQDDASDEAIEIEAEFEIDIEV